MSATHDTHRPSLLLRLFPFQDHSALSSTLLLGLQEREERWREEREIEGREMERDITVTTKHCLSQSTTTTTITATTTTSTVTVTTTIVTTTTTTILDLMQSLLLTRLHAGQLIGRHPLGK